MQLVRRNVFDQSLPFDCVFGIRGFGPLLFDQFNMLNPVIINSILQAHHHSRRDAFTAEILKDFLRATILCQNLMSEKVLLPFGMNFMAPQAIRRYPFTRASKPFVRYENTSIPIYSGDEFSDFEGGSTYENGTCQILCKMNGVGTRNKAGSCLPKYKKWRRPIANMRPVEMKALPRELYQVPHVQNRMQLVPGNSLMMIESLRNRTIISIKGFPYRKLRLLGEGYHSVVFEAANLRTGASCAIKIVSFAHIDPKEQNELYEIFLKEINFLARLGPQSPHITKIYEYEIDNFTFTGKIVMELGKEDFRALLPLRASPMSKIIQEPRRKHFWRQMVEAIRVLHANMITHSDVKPENFIFVGPILKIIDFGMSFQIPPGRTTQIRPFAGTPDYMPPEVCRTTGIYSKFGYKADIWSLGCILYEMSFGVRPFEYIRDDVQKMKVIGSLNKPLMISNTNDPYLTSMLQWCLQPKASNRPTAEQILAHPYLVSK